MTAPVWMALPPEVNASLLSSGPGPASLLAAAGAWQSLSTEYSTAAAELTSVLSGVQAGVWEGASAEQYVAAHAPYLTWLAQSSANSAVAAMQHETAAAAYTAALAAMPTMAELALNHATHAVLLGTNFLGINTIPIALNEADYVRMWIQAAATMAAYQAVSGAALAATPATMPAPFVLTPGVGEAGRAAADVGQATAQVQALDAGSSFNLVDIIAQLLKGYTDYVNQLFAPITNFLSDPVGNSIQLITDFFTNPAQALVTWGPFLSAIAYQAVSWVGAALTYPQLLIQPLLAITLGIVGGIAQQLQALAAPPPAPAEAGAAPAPAPAVTRVEQPAGYPVAGIAPTVGTAASAPAALGAGAPGAGAPAAGVAAPAVPYAVSGGDPDEGFTPTLREGTGGRAPASDISAMAGASAAASAAVRRTRRRRRTVEEKGRGYADVYEDYEEEEADAPPAEEPRISASPRGAGTLGFSGTTAKGTADAAGLTALQGDSFGGGPVSPMLPGSWDPDGTNNTDRREENP
jgi:PPE-repeat protein